MTVLRSLTMRLPLLVVLALASACAQLPPESGPAAPESVSADGVQHVTVLVSNEMRFSPSRIVVKAGKPIELTLRSIGLAPHDLFLAEGANELVKVAVDGGRSTTATFTLVRPGTYTFICSVPGHSDGGMHGSIVAEE
jgi:nitrite reductase (NO-forming)